MRALSRRFFLAAALCSVALSTAGCLSPTLPLPPPSPPDIEQVGSGQYTLRGTIPEPGFVLTLNHRTNAVTGARVDDIYQLSIQAQPGDSMQLWYETAADISDIVEFEIPKDAKPAPAPTASDAGAP
jgi:hypothetical protein